MNFTNYWVLDIHGQIACMPEPGLMLCFHSEDDAGVTDESGYWEDRDAARLVKEIEKWNEMIAGAVGAMKDTLEKLGEDAGPLMSEITKFPNFEHLEAKGGEG